MLKLRDQLAPILIAVVLFFVLGALFYAEILGLNLFGAEKIVTQVRFEDVLIGLTIYLKTSVDFAILIGLLMNKYPGFKNRVIIETGTAFGNALGTMLVLGIWFFFKEIKILLAGMIFLASLVLLQMAKESLEHTNEDSHDLEKEEESKTHTKNPTWYQVIAQKVNDLISPIVKFFEPFVSKILPESQFNSARELTVKGLIFASLNIPFILGMDDFAGYVPLFKVVNVFGFGLGVFLGHTILNVLLFASPQTTIKLVKNPIIALVGGLVFVGLSVWGFWEAGHMLFELITHHI
jgi:hypothetical protein